MGEAVRHGRPRWTREQARVMGRKGGKAPRKNGPQRTPEYKAGYSAGWVACERFYRASREDR